MLIGRQDGRQRTLSEESLVHVRADEFVARLDPGDRWTVRLHVSERGRPLAGVWVNLFLLLPQVPPGAQFPVDGLTVPGSVLTGEDGTAEATLVAADPGDARDVAALPVQQSQELGAQDGGQPVGHGKLAVQVFQMLVNRALTDREAVGDCRRGPSVGQQVKDGGI